MRKTWRHKTALVVAVLLALATALCLGACRYTDILTEHLEDPISGELDINAEPTYEYDPSAPLDDTRPAVNPKTSDNKNDQENTAPSYSTDNTVTVPTDKPIQEPESDEEEEPEEGKEKSKDEGEATTTNEEAAGESTQEEASEEEEDAEEETADEGEAEDSDPGDEGQGGDEGTGGKGGKGKVYNDGTYKELPEDVGTIAATGQYAIIVQMLAGKGGLAACDASTLKAMKSAGAFEYEGDGEGEDPEGLNDIDVAWSGDGSKNDSLDIDALIEAKPDAVLTDGSTTALSADQTDRLMEEGIDVVSAPVIGNTYTPDDDILTAVRLVGTLLKKADTQYSASKMASEYSKEHKAAIDACLDTNGGYSYKTVYGDQWASIYQGEDEVGQPTTAVSQVKIATSYIDKWTTNNNVSVVAARKWHKNELYLNGVTLDATEGVGLSVTASNGTFALMDYYLQVSGVVNNSYNTSVPGKLPYPIVAGSAEGLLNIQFAQRNVPSALWFSTSNGEFDPWITVGDDNYPAILTRSVEIADNVVSSGSKSNGLYNVGQGYKVWVVPSGLSGSWADGTVESFLLSPWAFDMFQGGGKPGDACNSYTDTFYQTFYRCSYEDVVENYHTSKRVKKVDADEAE